MPERELWTAIYRALKLIEPLIHGRIHKRAFSMILSAIQTYLDATNAALN